DRKFIRERVQSRVAVQGNLDPLALLAGGDTLDRAVDAIMADFKDGRFIFNLGHGILPPTPIAHVERMLKRVRGGEGSSDVSLGEGIPRYRGDLLDGRDALSAAAV